MSSSRVFLVLSKRLCTNSEINFTKQQLQRLISTIWMYLDYFLDTVRHTARDTMMNIIKIKGIVLYIYSKTAIILIPKT